MVAWHGSADLKAEVLARMVAHRAADEIIQGRYQLIDPEAASGYEGCLIGCTLPAQPLAYGCEARRPNGGWHEEVERLYGIPKEIGHMLDDTFEGLAEGHADFAVRSIEAVPVGADLSLVASRVALDVLTDDVHGLIGRATAEQRPAVEESGRPVPPPAGGR